MRAYYAGKTPEDRYRLFVAGRDPDRIRLVDSLAYRMARDSEKVRARRILMRAMQSGKLPKQPCEVCGDERVQAHHDDYGKPLEVRWLCLEHHTAIHHPYIAKEVGAATF